jgi:starch-binding outer membrane protein, SusD/RagB family
MKRFCIALFTSLAVIGFMTQCEDIIDETQKDLIEPELALSKITTYDQLVNSAYDRMQSFNYLAQRQMLVPDALADNGELVNNTGRYVGELVNQAQAHLNLYFLYSAANDCNIVIDKIDTLYQTLEPTPTVAQRGTIRAAIAQALFLRSMAYFDMVRIYGYEPNQIVNGWDKGVIIRDKPVFDVGQVDLKPRATVEETYQFIEEGLLRAIDSLEVPATTVANQPFRVNLAAAHGLLAKVYLYWGKYDLAVTEVDAVNATKPAATRLATAAEYVGMWNTAPTAGRVESLFEVRLDPGNGSNRDWSSVDGVNESLHSITTTGLTASSQFILAGSESLMEAFEPGDVRANLWTEVNVRGQNYNMSLKWPGSAGAGLWADNIPVLRMSEMVLIQAESYYHQGLEPEARTVLNELRTRRGLSALDGTTSGNSLFDVIMNEWRVEFAFEGHRFFDLKRNGLDIPKANGEPLLYTDFRVLAPIPFNQITLNPVLEQNPGY